MNKMTRSFGAVLTAGALATLAACGSSPRYDPPASYPAVGGSTVPVNGQYGRVTSINVIGAGERTTGAGAVLGALVGAAVGNQVGSGSGRTAATGVGAVGGAIIGNQIEKRRADDVYRVTVRYDNGFVQQYDYERIDNLRIGDRVMYENGNLRIVYG
jgi:outer membrane lipoprotein SlyB